MTKIGNLFSGGKLYFVITATMNKKCESVSENKVDLS